MIFLACSIESISRTKFVAVLAHTGNDATTYQGFTDRLAALSLADHDLPLKSGESIEEVSNGVRKISAVLPTTLALLVGSYLLTSARQASDPPPPLLVRTTFNAFLLQKRISA